jgi:hypothetical protein
MAGNLRSGKRRDKANRPAGTAERPRKPDDLNKSSADYWDLLVDNARHLTSADEDAILSAVQLRWLYLEAHAAASCDPLDKDTRIAVCAYHTAWQGTLKFLCVDPIGRERIQSPAAESDDPLKALGIVG